MQASMSRQSSAICRAIAENIRHYRTVKGLTQDQLAELAGVTRCTVNRYENAHYRAHIDTACIIADALGVSLDILRRPAKEFSHLRRA